MDRPLVGVALIVQKDNKILLHKRKSPHAPGTWACPGGHLEKWETFEDAALRELAEEAGPLVVTKPRFFTAANTRFYDEDKHYVVIFMLADWVAGDPEVMEPDKCECWGWFDYKNLPEPLMQGIEDIKNRGFLGFIMGN